MKISVEYLTDSSECETCGGSYAQGFICRVDGKERIRRTPVASCLGGDDWNDEETWQIIIKEIYGDELEFTH